MIKVENLTKRYGSFTAVDSISLSTRPGRITGFLGPNGAGKSTAMRMIVGLTPPTSGSATIFDRPYRNIPNPARFVGTMLDASAQHGGRTGRETLSLVADVVGATSSHVDYTLERVGLTQKEAGRRVGNYSLGMRQRLGIASALIGRPHVLILDEPANGLDPAGIRWMRGLLKDFAADGGSVLLSSHLLSEVERIVDDIVLIGHGKIVAQGDLKELLNQGGAIANSLDNTHLISSLHHAGFDARPHDDGVITDADPEQVGHIALNNRIVLLSLNSPSTQLEETFLNLTASSAREEIAA